MLLSLGVFFWPFKALSDHILFKVILLNVVFIALYLKGPKCIRGTQNKQLLTVKGFLGYFTLAVTIRILFIINAFLD